MRRLSCLLTLLTLSAPIATAQRAVTVRLQVPPAIDSGESYYLSAEHQRWAPADSAYRFRRVGDQWELTFQFTSKYFLQYRITRGSDVAVESSAEGYPTRPRLAEITRDTLLSVTVAGWADRIVRKSTASPQVQLFAEAFAFPTLSRSHRVWVYLPRGYASSRRRYPVMYLMDGEALFDRAQTDDGEEWEVDETLDRTTSADAGMIVVGIEGGSKRVSEYLPYATTSGRPTSEGRAFVHDLVTTLMPAISQRYRVQPGRKTTAIGGSSMGAFIALFAALEHPDRFGGVAAFSPPQWTGLPMDSLERAVAQRGAALRARVMLYAGGQEMGDAYVARTRAFATALGRWQGVVSRFELAPTGEHRARDWRVPFAQFAAWWQVR
jgi:predicted alpha/beta superfamily hydrolase